MVIGAVVVAVAVPFSPARAEPRRPGTADASPLAWHACPSGDFRGGPAEAARFACATLPVPLDYRHPGARTLGLAVIRFQAANPGERIGSLVLNPGGPGASGVDAAIDAATSLPEGLRARFDIVGFDPRGVGRTSPVRCWDQARYATAFRHARARPQPGAFTAALDAGRRFREACRKSSGDLLPYLGTEFVARDLDRLRAALGDERLTYLGLSYGTFIGTVYANLFPKRVRALALDGAYDPNRYANDPYAYDRGQYVAVEGALNRFLAWCAGAGTACHFGAGDPAAALDRLIGRLDRDGVAVNAFWLLYHLVFAMDEGTPYWATLADRLRAAESGEGGLLTPISRQTAEFLTANTVVECSDRVFPTSGRLLARKLSEEARLGRRLAPALAYGPPGYDHSHAPACSRWESPRRSRYSGPFSARGAPPILVVGTTGDPDTPYPDAVALADTLDRAWLLTFHGEGHTGLAHSRCAAEVITRYLVERTRPAVEVCDDNPPPG